jgi:hypothetical protein
VYTSQPASGTIFRIKGGFLYAFSVSLKRVAERFSELVSNFIEASKNFDFVIYISKSS